MARARQWASRSISEVKTNPGKFHDKTVTVEGVVTTSFGIPLVPFKVYRVSDGSEEMLVISDDNRIPSKNARVRVRGRSRKSACLAADPSDFTSGKSRLSTCKQKVLRAYGDGLTENP